MSDNPIIDLSQLSITLSDYQVGKSQALTDSALLPLVRNYKRTVASRLYPLSAKDIADKVSDAQYHVSRKIDGEFNVLIYKDGILLTLNPGGTIRTGLPWMTEAKQLLDNVSLTNVMIAGELYVDTPGRRPRVHDALALLDNLKPTKNWRAYDSACLTSFRLTTSRSTSLTLKHGIKSNPRFQQANISTL